MKKVLVIAAVTVLSASAFASKARKTALANSIHINDIQDVLTEPDKAAAYGEWATMEFGSTAGANSRAEGGFVKMMGQSAMGAYLGSANATADAYRTLGATGTGGAFLAQENPIRLFYANKMSDMSWGVGLYHSASKNKTSATLEKKQDAMGVTASASTDVWEAQLAVGLSNNAVDKVVAGEHKIKGKSSITLAGNYKFDTMTAYASYATSGFDAETAGTGAKPVDRADSLTKIGVVNSHKKDGTDFFYGIEYGMQVEKDSAENPIAGSLGAVGNDKRETTTMPIFVGIESEATSWMVLRGSISQSVNLLGLAKVKTSNKTNSDNDTERVGADNTVVAAGAGFKWNKFTVDSQLLAASDNGGDFGTGAGDFLSRVSFTYNF